ncbi:MULTISPECIES: ABC transporter permease [unclassified Devosia]|uniref:ABC transporter permease n=1 Tax=unclassified Devosia TaxID=196773 RepID=UPI00145F3CC7|nr:MULTISPECIES: ABC transporter permease [unclassified Devosia]MBJ6988332.1 ABC transporter permease [Devosia sp. MC521]MBJ7579060.1 ABC transporter permease [Devosia sp. MC532]MBK1795908.1 ABC transporter permease [Devosia sp. WQ 349K1]QMW63052.1 ABC transporter permease [Devosia sp. MC521]
MDQFIVDLTLVLDSTTRLAVPLILACLAGLYSERAGIVDIGLEGKLLAGAFAAAATAAVTGSAWLGLLAGIGAALVFSGIHGLASINFKGNQAISGVALNFLAAGLTTFLGQSWFKRGGYTPQLSGDQRFNPITLPFAEELKGVPVIGQIYNELISGHNIITYFAFIAVPVTAWVLFRTRFGLRLRAVGENPKAIDTAGISVTRLRYQALIITAVLVGIGGAYLSIAQSAGFNNNMSAGRGYIALAALIFAKWRPGPALLVCLMFGFLDAVQFRIQGQVFPIIGEVPVQAIQALPYILTVILLAGFVGRAVAPKASGIPYTKER